MCRMEKKTKESFLYFFNKSSKDNLGIMIHNNNINHNYQLSGEPQDDQLSFDLEYPEEFSP